MDFTETLNAQVRQLSLGFDNNSNVEFDTNEPSSITIQEEIQKLKMMLDIRMKYTVPKLGGEWKFDYIPQDINSLRSMIKFIDENSNHLYGDIKSRELTVDQLDKIIGVRFESYLSYERLIEEIVNNINGSKGFKHIRKLFIESIPQELTDEWCFLGSSISQIQYKQYYDSMDKICKEWLIQYGLKSITKIKEYLISNMNLMSTYDMINYLIKNYDKSQQIQELLSILINRSNSDQYLEKGYLPYITYLDHLSSTIENSISNCKNPYRTIYLLQLVVQGMYHKPEILRGFAPLLGDFLARYPDFTLYELSQYLKEHNLPNL